MDRRDIIKSDRNRKRLRASMQAQLSEAKTELQPRAIGARFINGQKQKLTKQTRFIGDFLADNKSWVFVGGIGTLLIAARLPISKRLNKLRGIATNNDVEE
jgi:DNA replication protein DnaC